MVDLIKRVDFTNIHDYFSHYPYGEHYFSPNDGIICKPGSIRYFKVSRLYNNFKLFESPNIVFHRLDGPAEYSWTGYTYWYINGIFLDTEIREWANNNDIDLDNLTEVDKALIKMVWANYGI